MKRSDQEQFPGAPPQAQPGPLPADLTGRKRAWSNPQSAFHRYAIVVIFAVACLMLSLFILEQQQIIDSQRALIRQLFQDSQELNGMKIQNLHPATNPKRTKN